MKSSYIIGLVLILSVILHSLSAAAAVSGAAYWHGSAADARNPLKTINFGERAAFTVSAFEFFEQPDRNGNRILLDVKIYRGSYQTRSQIDQSQLIETLVEASTVEEELHIPLLLAAQGDTQNAQNVNFFYDQAGDYTIVATVRGATTGVASEGDQPQLLRLHVNPQPNVCPVFTLPEERQTIAEGQRLQFTVTATDANQDALDVTASGLPRGARFTDNGDGTGSFTWTPDSTQAGEYDVTFTADDGICDVDRVVHITVTDVALNNPPVLDPVGDKEVAEGETLTFTLTARDPDRGDTLRFGVGDSPPGAKLDRTTGVFTWTPTFDQGNDDPTEYRVTFQAGDNHNAFSEPQTITIRVDNLNRDPQLQIDVAQNPVTEGENVIITVTATDPDTQDTIIPSFTWDNALPGSVPSIERLENNKWRITWETDEQSAGEYAFTFQVRDRANTADPEMRTAQETVLITVQETANRAPVIDSFEITPNPANEGQVVVLRATFHDPDNDHLFFSFNWANNLPGEIPQVQLVGEDEVILSWQTDFASAGNHEFSFTVYDRVPNDPEQLSDTATATAIILNVNRPPVIDVVGDEIEVNENETVTFNVIAEDPDEPQVPLGITAVRGITSEESSDLIAVQRVDSKTIEVTVTPDFDFVDHPDLERKFEIVFQTTDSEGTVVEKVAEILVHDVNRDPVFAPVANMIVEAGEETTITLEAEDADNDQLSFAAENLPPGAVLDAEDGTFTWTPTAAQAGVHDITFIVTDNFGGEDRITVRITVTDEIIENNAPVFDEIEDQDVDEGGELRFMVTASDPDNDPLTYGVEGLPSGAAFNPATREFSWTPGFEQAGEYDITFTVTDGIDTARMAVHITVNDVPVINRPPQFVGLEDREVEEGETLTFTVEANDPENNPLTYSVEGLPPGAVFDPETQIFSWTPSSEQAGEYDITFTVTDGVNEIERTILITVLDVTDRNRPPVIISEPVTTAQEGMEYEYQVVAVDPDGDELRYFLIEGPRGMTMNREGLVTWEPERVQREEVTVAVSDGEFTVTQSYVIATRGGFRNMEIASIRLPDMVSITDQFVPITVAVENEGDIDLEDVRVRTIIPELGVVRSSSSFDLDSGEDRGITILIPLPYAAVSGEYLVQVLAGNDHFHDSGFRVVSIIE